jgi:hypothetical protein
MQKVAYSHPSFDLAAGGKEISVGYHWPHRSIEQATRRRKSKFIAHRIFPKPFIHVIAYPFLGLNQQPQLFKPCPQLSIKRVYLSSANYIQTLNRYTQTSATYSETLTGDSRSNATDSAAKTTLCPLKLHGCELQLILKPRLYQVMLILNGLLIVINVSKKK